MSCYFPHNPLIIDVDISWQSSWIYKGQVYLQLLDNREEIKWNGWLQNMLQEDIILTLWL